MICETDWAMKRIETAGGLLFFRPRYLNPTRHVRVEEKTNGVYMETETRKGVFVSRSVLEGAVLYLLQLLLPNVRKLPRVKRIDWELMCAWWTTWPADKINPIML